MKEQKFQESLVRNASVEEDDKDQYLGESGSIDRLDPD